MRQLVFMGKKKIVWILKRTSFPVTFSKLCRSASTSNSILGSSIKHRIKALFFFLLFAFLTLIMLIFSRFNFNLDCTAERRWIHLQTSLERENVSKAYQTKEGLGFVGSSPPKGKLRTFPPPDWIMYAPGSLFCTLHFRSLLTVASIALLCHCLAWLPRTPSAGMFSRLMEITRGVEEEGKLLSQAIHVVVVVVSRCWCEGLAYSWKMINN